MSATTSSSASLKDSEKGQELVLEKTDPSISQNVYGTAPDGGSRAWCVVLGGFLTYFVTFGLLNTYGTFQVYYSRHYLSNKSDSAISWIGTVQLFLLFIGGMFFGPLFDKKGSMVLFVPGTIMYVASIMFTSLSTQYYQFLLAQGILFGIGDAMLFYPTISTISHWFDKKRGLALGIVVAGSSLGGITWPLVLERLFEIVGFAWTLRIAGFICLALLVPACFMVVPRLPPASKKDIPPGEFAAMFKDIRYILLIAGMFLVMWGMFIPFYYIPLFAIKQGMNTVMANNLIAFVNAGSFLGRIVSGIGADKLGKYNITTLCAVLSAIILLCLQSMTSEPRLIAFSVLYGFFSGGLISLQSACVAQITENLQMLGIKIGIKMTICSIGVLTGGPIAGALITLDGGDYTGLTYFSGIILLAGSVLLGIDRVIQDKRLWAKV